MVALPYLGISVLHDAMALRSYAHAVPVSAKPYNALAWRILAIPHLAVALLLSQRNAPQNSAVAMPGDTLPVPWSAFPCPGHAVH